MEIFGERLRELRIAKGLSQKGLEQALNKQVTATGIGYWELGKRIPSFDLVILLAKFFNVSTDYLAGLED